MLLMNMFNLKLCDLVNYNFGEGRIHHSVSSDWEECTVGGYKDYRF
jgi:hypothetical protein